MNIATALSLLVDRVRQEACEALYIRTGLDRTRPLAIRGLVTWRCNFRCRYCDFWQRPPREEMSLADWRRALDGLRRLAGRFVIQFSGGEPLVRPEFPDIVAHCRQIGARWGMVSNGSLIDRRRARALVAARPTNIDISLDGPTAETHDVFRGFPGSLARIEAAVGYLAEEQHRQGHRFPIRIKATVHRHNFRHLPALVDWVASRPACTVDFQPIRPWTPAVEEELWIEDPATLADLAGMVRTLERLRAAGAPIETEPARLRTWPDHFRRRTVATQLLPCRVGLRDFHVQPDGSVFMCWLYPSIGNVREASVTEIWHGAEARRQRREMLTCPRLGSPGCANTCLSHRRLRDDIRRGLLMLRRTGRRRMNGGNGAG